MFIDCIKAKTIVEECQIVTLYFKFDKRVNLYSILWLYKQHFYSNFLVANLRAKSITMSVLRLKLILDKITGTRFVTHKEIMDYLMREGIFVARETFYRDIKKIEYDYGIEISRAKVTEGDKSVYGYRVNRNTSLNYDDTVSFINSTSVIELFKMKFGSSAELRNYISTGGVKNSGGALWLNTVVKAMTQRHVLRFDYQKYNDEMATERIVEPYFLKSYHNIWYLLAWEVATNSMKVFGLDRAREIQMTDDFFERDQLFNAAKYFNNQIGVFIDTDRNPEHIVVKVFKPLSNRIQKKPLHHSQNLVQFSDDYIIMSLYVIPDSEFYTEIFKLRNYACIISPDHIRENMKSMIKKMNDNYG